MVYEQECGASQRKLSLSYSRKDKKEVSTQRLGEEWGDQREGGRPQGAERLWSFFPPC